MSGGGGGGGGGGGTFREGDNTPFDNGNVRYNHQSSLEAVLARGD